MANIPPGSMGLPLIGHTREFLQPHSAMSTGTFMENRQLRFGKVFKCHLFGHPTVVSCDSAFNKFILHNEGKLFEASYPSSTCTIFGKWSMLVLGGDLHKQMRSIAMNFMRPDKLKDTFLEDIEKNVILSLKSWPTEGILRAQQACKQFTFNLIAHQMLSMNPGEPDMAFFINEYQHFMSGLIAFPINLPGTAYNKALRSKNRILEKLKDIMSERKMNPRVKYTDFLQFITEESTLKLDQILDLVMNMLFAGHETSSVALTLAINFLTTSPETLRELRIEHAKIRATKTQENEKLSWEDYKRMEFTQYVIKETLRLGNVVRFVHRKAIEDVFFKGYHIPKGWKVLPVFTAPHLDQDVYENPLQFDPRRWQNAQKNPYFTPFGGGIRHCAGMELAKLEMAIFLHHLTLNYEWTLAEPDMPMAFPFVECPKGLPIKLIKLQSNSLCKGR